MILRNRSVESTEVETRRTVIPAPKSDGMFRGWGVRF